MKTSFSQEFSIAKHLCEITKMHQGENEKKLWTREILNFKEVIAF